MKSYERQQIYIKREVIKENADLIELGVEAKLLGLNPLALSEIGHEEQANALFHLFGMLESRKLMGVVENRVAKAMKEADKKTKAEANRAKKALTPVKEPDHFIQDNLFPVNSSVELTPLERDPEEDLNRLHGIMQLRKQASENARNRIFTLEAQKEQAQYLVDTGKDLTDTEKRAQQREKLVKWIEQIETMGLKGLIFKSLTLEDLDRLHEVVSGWRENPPVIKQSTHRNLK